jgi:hypothetical protein
VARKEKDFAVGSLIQGNKGAYYEGWLGLIVKEEGGYFYFHWLILPPGAARAQPLADARRFFHLCKP